jgi:hypothetical protein
VTSFTQRLKSINFFQTTVFANTDVNFRSILMSIQLFSSYFRERIFFFLYLNSSVMQVCVFQQQKLVSIREKSKHTSEKKNKKKLESKEIQTRKTKTKHAQKVHVKTSCNKSLGKLKESRKILNDGKTILLMVPWVRVDSDSIISLLSI